MVCTDGWTDELIRVELGNLQFLQVNSYTFSTILYVDSTADQSRHSPNHITTMAEMTEIAPNDIITALPPLLGASPLVHIPHAGDGQSWPLASARIAVAVASTPQPR